MAVKSAVSGVETTWRSGNTSVYVEHDGIHGTPSYQRDVVVELHGNEIARFDSALSHQKCRGLRITDAGWRTATTKSRLNALLQCFCEGSSIYQKKGQWFTVDGTEFYGTDWLSYGWRDGWFNDRAERLAETSQKASKSVYDVQWHQATAEALAAAKALAAATALA